MPDPTFRNPLPKDFSSHTGHGKIAVPRWWFWTCLLLAWPAFGLVIGGLIVLAVK